MMSSSTELVVLHLTADEALVLDALLSRFDAEEKQSTSIDIQHPAERAALWALQATLEQTLVAPLKEDYGRLLAAAQQRLCDRAGL